MIEQLRKTWIFEKIIFSYLKEDIEVDNRNLPRLPQENVTTTHP